MQAKVISFLAAASVSILAGCETPQETLTPAGPVVADAGAATPNFADLTGKCRVAPTRHDQYALFQVAYTCALRQAVWVASGQVRLGEAGPQDSYKVMLREGLGLVRGNCSDFFRKRGDNQQTINLSRDLVALSSATAVAVVGVSGGTALALSIIALTGGALYGGIDTYTKNFLFGADNIESVRTLTMKALEEHSSAVMAASGTLGFHDVSAAIMDNQELCKPASIAASVREAIKNGRPGIQQAGESGNTRGLTDRAIVAEIGELVGTGGTTISDGQLAALCWAATADGAAAANQAKIKEVLYPPESFGYGPENNDTWRSRGVALKVNARCSALSESAKANVQKIIAEFKGAAAGSATFSMTVRSAMPRSPTMVSPTTSDVGPKFVPITVR